MMNKQQSKYVFSETDIKKFVDESVVSVPFEDFVTLIIDTNEQLLKTSSLRSKSVLISKYTKDDILIYSYKLELPQSKDVSFDNILEPFSKNTPEKKEIRTKKISLNVNNVLIVLSLILAITSLAMSVNSKTKEVTNKKLENKVTTLEKSLNNQKVVLDNQNTLLENEGKIDVYVRYFLPYLFSENKISLDDFVSDEISKDIKHQQGSLISVMQEEIKLDKKGFKAIYVISVKEENINKTKRVELDIEKNKSKKFEFEIKEIPKIQEIK